MPANVVALLYLASGVLFILALRIRGSAKKSTGAVRVVALLALLALSPSGVAAQQTVPKAPAPAAQPLPPLTPELMALRNKVMESIRALQPRVRPEDLAKCTAVLQRPNWSGGQYRIEGAYQIDLRVSCLAHRGPSLFNPDRRNRGIGYTVRLVKIAGGFGSGHPRDTGFCEFTELEGKIELTQTAIHERKINGVSSCVNLR